MSYDTIPSGELAETIMRQAKTLRQISEWCDNPNLSPYVYVILRDSYSPGFVLRRIAERYEQAASKLANEKRKP